jgi:MoxR-like ATPase
MSNFEIFKSSREPHYGLAELPLPPPWRTSSSQEPPTVPKGDLFNLEHLEFEATRGKPIRLRDEVKRAVNAALFLRRPLLVTGKPGVGKSSLAYAVAYELRMGPVLRWPITSRSSVKNALYEYDAIGRLYAQQTGERKIKLADFIVLGPLGTALYPTTWPRVLLIDEIDKGDLDLPNDLLDVLEEGMFEIAELVREGGYEKIPVSPTSDDAPKVKLHGLTEPQPVPGGRVRCRQFPLIVMTSNGEREFPAPFLRRCIQVLMPEPSHDELMQIVLAHLGDLDAVQEGGEIRKEIDGLINVFINRRSKQLLATDQLLNAAFTVLKRNRLNTSGGEEKEREQVIELILTQLTTVRR